MFNRFRKFLRNYLDGEEITVEGEVTFTWWEVGAIVVIIGLLIRWIWW
jgi:hypothetical protein